MSYTRTPHLQHHVFQNRENPTKNTRAQGEVRQDKRAVPRARTASSQPARSALPLRAQPLTTAPPRSQNGHVVQRRTAPLTIWIRPIEKAEVERRAAREDLSLSAVGAAFFRKGMQADLDLHYGALLEPVFETILYRRMSTRDNRLALLLVRDILATEQTRILTTNLLGRQPGITPEVLNDILDRSHDEAKKKITRRSPELEELIQEVKSWLVGEEQKEKNP